MVEQCFYVGFYFLQIGMMVEIVHKLVNLDNLMNEGIAFAIDRFKDNIPNCPIGQRPVMIGKRKPAFNTIDKVMARLDRIMKVREAMRFLVIDVH